MLYLSTERFINFSAVYFDMLLCEISTEGVAVSHVNVKEPQGARGGAPVFIPPPNFGSADHTSAH